MPGGHVEARVRDFGKDEQPVTKEQAMAAVFFEDIHEGRSDLGLSMPEEVQAPKKHDASSVPVEIKIVQAVIQR